MSYFVAHIYLYKLFLKKFIEQGLDQSNWLDLDPNTSLVQSTVRVSKHWHKYDRLVNDFVFFNQKPQAFGNSKGQKTGRASNY